MDDWVGKRLADCILPTAKELKALVSEMDKAGEGAGCAPSTPAHLKFMTAYSVAPQTHRHLSHDQRAVRCFGRQNLADTGLMEPS